MSQKRDILFDISISERKMIMTYQEKYESLMEKYIKKKKVTISGLQKKEKLPYPLAEKLYIEWKNYHDELYWHNAVYEISFMEEPPTPARIMDMFNISYCFAKKLFDYYIEVSNEY